MNGESSFLVRERVLGNGHAIGAWIASFPHRRTPSATSPARRRSRTMSILMFILFGLIIGFLARAIMPGKQSMGLVATGLVGIIGSFIGGFVGNLLGGRPLLD